MRPEAVGDRVAVGEDRSCGRVHVAVVGEVGLERPEQIGVVAAVVGDERLDGLLVEAADLVGVGRHRPEQQSVDAVVDLGAELVGDAVVA